MPFCSIMTCKHDSRNVNLSHGGVTYHLFPKDPELRETWVEATGRVNWKPAKTSTICSAHFDEKHFMIKNKHRRSLCIDAVPTLNVLSFHSEMQIVKFEQIAENINVAEILKEHQITDENLALMVPVAVNDADKNFTENELKLKAMLKWTRFKINKQKTKIKNCEMQIYRLKTKSEKTKKLLDLLQDKFAMPLEEIVKIDFRH